MGKLFFLNSCGFWGGGEKWTLDTARELDNRGHDVYIGGLPGAPLLKKAKGAGITTRAVKVKSGISSLNPVKVLKLARFLTRASIDGLFMNLSRDLKFGCAAGNLAGLEKIIYRRGLDRPIKNRFYNKLLLNKMTTNIIANSKSTKKSILKNTREWLNPDKIAVIPNGLKIQDVDKSISKANSLLESYPDIEHEDKLILGNVGRLTEQKGQDILLKTARELENYDFNDFLILIIGDGELNDELQKMSVDLGLEEKILFLGYQEQSRVYQLMAEFDFLVHPARWEGFGYVLIESMAAGTPVIAADKSNIAEIIENGKNGYLVDSLNPSEFASKILELKDRDLSDVIENARSFVEDNYSRAKVIKEIEKLIL